MNNILTLSKLTLREAFARKIFIIFAGVSTLVLLVFAILFISFSIEDVTEVFGANSEVDMSEALVSQLQFLILAPLFGIGLFLSIFSTSSFIPHMLEKGSIDLLLSKPVSRAQVILGKFFGGLTVVFLNVGYLIIGIWFLLGLKFGVWNIDFLYSIPVITFAFATLYAMIILVGITTRSSVLAMMISYLIFIVFSPLLSVRENIYSFIESDMVKWALDAFYYIVPKTSELSDIMSDLVSGDGIVEWQPILTSLAFIILIIYLSISIFSKKDY